MRPVPNFGVCHDVGFQVGRLRKSFVTVFERTNVWPISSVNAFVGTKIEVEGKPLATTLKIALERFLSSVNQLMSLEFTRFNESFTTFRTDVNPRSMRVEMLPHG